MGATVCVDCGRAMRAQGRSEEEFPGTRVHMGRGLCTACYSRGRREEAGKQARRRRVMPAVRVMVPVRTELSQTTYRAFAKVASERGVTVGVLLSRFADASVTGRGA